MTEHTAPRDQKINKSQEAKATGDRLVAGDSATMCASHCYSTPSPPICQPFAAQTNAACIPDSLPRPLVQAFRLGCRHQRIHDELETLISGSGARR